MDKVLYLWKEYDELCYRIVEAAGGQKRTEFYAGKWRKNRNISDREYDLIYREMAEAWQRAAGGAKE
jgi:hypothetical protein